MEALYIRPGGGERAWQVWPVSEAIPEGAVQEGGEHIIELTGVSDGDAAELAIEGLRLRALRSPSKSAARWAWSPGFNAGRVEAVLTLGHRPVNLVLETDPATRKLARAEFDTMVREVIEDTLALLSIGGHRKGLGTSPGRPPPLARLEYLRSRAEAVIASVYAINQRPRTSLSAEDVSVPYWLARGATGAEVIRSLRSGRVLHESNLVSVLPGSLQGMMPARIKKRARMSSFDIPEHRMIRACVRYWAAWLISVSSALGADATPDSETWDRRKAWASSLKAIGRRLEQLLHLPLFDGVRESSPRVQATPLFRHDPAYRAFFRLAIEMELGLTNIIGDFLDLPLARTHEIYELWCFLKLARAAALEAGSDIDLDRLFTPTPGGIEFVRGTASVRAGEVTVWFQRPFREFWVSPEGTGSMSREMIPDITISRVGADKVVAMDAKYRVDQDLGAAISSAHTYRDAIVVQHEGRPLESLVAGSYLLTPHQAAVSSAWRSTKMPERLFHPDYRREFRFGAWSMRPGGPEAQAAAALSSAVADLA